MSPATWWRGAFTSIVQDARQLRSTKSVEYGILLWAIPVGALVAGFTIYAVWLLSATTIDAVAILAGTGVFLFLSIPGLSNAQRQRDEALERDARNLIDVARLTTKAADADSAVGLRHRVDEHQDSYRNHVGALLCMWIAGAILSGVMVWFALSVLVDGFEAQE